MANITNQMKTGQVNTFTGGINTDLNPVLQPKDTLTDCVNGTIITYNSNENMLQNDMGNYKLKNAKLPEGYIPLGMKEYGGIIYLVLANPNTGKVQLGSYPSPQTKIEEVYDTELSDGIIYEISPVEIQKFEGEIKDFDFFSKEAEKYFYSKLDKSNSKIIFTSDFGDDSMFEVGDKFSIATTFDESEEEPYQKLKYFSLNDEKTKYSLDENLMNIKTLNSDTPIEEFDEDDEYLKQVSWQFPGWVGCEYIVNDLISNTQEVETEITQITNEITIFDTIEKYDNKTYILKTPDYSDEKMMSITESFKNIPTNEIWLELPMGKECLKIEDIDGNYIYNIDSVSDENHFVEIKFKSPVYSAEFLENVIPGVADKIILPSTILYIPENIPTYTLFVNHHIIKLPDSKKFKWVKKLYTPKEIDESWFDSGIVYLTDTYEPIDSIYENLTNEGRHMMQTTGSDLEFSVDLNQDSKIKSIVFGSSHWTKLTSKLFYGYKEIEYVNCGKITEISSMCFQDCSNLKEVVIPNILKIGSLAFSGCENVRVFKLETSYETINLGAGCFRYCKGDLYLNSEYNSEYSQVANGIVGGAFSLSLFNSVVIGDNVTTIKERSFMFNSISEIKFGKRLNKIDTGAFGNSGNLTSVEFNSDIVLKNSCFSRCENLSNVVFNGDCILHKQCFELCTSISQIDFFKRSYFYRSGDFKTNALSLNSIWTLNFYEGTNFNLDLDLYPSTTWTHASICYYCKQLYDFGSQKSNIYLYVIDPDIYGSQGYKGIYSISKYFTLRFKGDNNERNTRARQWLVNSSSWIESIGGDPDRTSVSSTTTHSDIKIKIPYSENITTAIPNQGLIDSVIIPEETEITNVFNINSEFDEIISEGGSLRSWTVRDTRLINISFSNIKTIGFPETTEILNWQNIPSDTRNRSIYFNSRECPTMYNFHASNYQNITFYVPKGFKNNYEQILTSNNIEEFESDETNKFTNINSNEIIYERFDGSKLGLSNNIVSINDKYNIYIDNSEYGILKFNQSWMIESVKLECKAKTLMLKNVDRFVYNSSRHYENVIFLNELKYFEVISNFELCTYLYFQSNVAPKFSSNVIFDKLCTILLTPSRELWWMQIGNFEINNLFDYSNITIECFSSNSSIYKLPSALEKNGYFILDSYLSTLRVSNITVFKYENTLKLDDDIWSDIQWLFVPDNVNSFVCKNIGCNSLYLPSGIQFEFDSKKLSNLYLRNNAKVSNEGNEFMDVYTVENTDFETYLDYLNNTSQILINDELCKIISFNDHSITLLYNSDNLGNNINLKKFGKIDGDFDSKRISTYSIFSQSYNFDPIDSGESSKLHAAVVYYELKLNGKNTIKFNKDDIEKDALKLAVNCNLIDKFDIKQNDKSFDSYDQIEFDYSASKQISSQDLVDIVVLSKPYMLNDAGKLLIFDNHSAEDVISTNISNNDSNLIKYQYKAQNVESTKFQILLEFNDVMSYKDLEFNFYKIVSKEEIKQFTLQVNNNSNIYRLENINLDPNSVYVFEIHLKSSNTNIRRYLLTFPLKINFTESIEPSDYNTLFYDDFDTNDFEGNIDLFDFQWLSDETVSSKFKCGAQSINIDSDEIFHSIVCNKFDRNAERVEWNKLQTRPIVINGNSEYSKLVDSSEKVKLSLKLHYDDNSSDSIDLSDLNSPINIVEKSAKLELVKTDNVVPIRQYLIKGAPMPTTLFDDMNNVEDLSQNRFGWSENMMNYIYSSSTAGVVNYGTTLFIEKCNGGKEVEVYYDNNGVESPKTVCSHESDIERVLNESVKKSQLFVPIEANSNSRKSGFTIPVPVLTDEKYQLDYPIGSKKLNSTWCGATEIFDKKTDVWKSILVGVALGVAVLATIVTFGGALIGLASLATMLAVGAGMIIGPGLYIAAAYGLVHTFREKEGMKYFTYGVKIKNGGHTKLLLPLWYNKKFDKSQHPWYFIDETKEKDLHSFINWVGTHLYYYTNEEIALFEIEENSIESKSLKSIEVVVETIGSKMLDGLPLEIWNESSFISIDSNNFKCKSKGYVNKSQSFIIDNIGENLTFKNNESVLSTDIGKSFDGVVHCDFEIENEEFENIKWFVKYLRVSGEGDIYYEYPGAIPPKSVCFGGNRGDYKLSVEWKNNSGKWTTLLKKVYHASDKDGYCPIAYHIDPNMEENRSVLNETLDNLKFKPSIDIPEYLKYLVNYE